MATSPTVVFKKRRRPVATSRINVGDKSKLISEHEKGYNIKLPARNNTDDDSSSQDSSSEDEGGVLHKISTQHNAKRSRVNVQKSSDSTDIAKDSSSFYDLNQGPVADPEEHVTKTGKKIIGPVKETGPSTIRTITVVDYQPDVCKDYKETGFCGYGDSCKFLHDRGDYKAGWQLERDWEIDQKHGKGDKTKDKTSETTENYDIPFACYICRKDYTRPIVTRCNHYFCEKCALSRFKKDPTCAICGSGTQGIFNRASKLEQKLAARAQK